MEWWFYRIKSRHSRYSLYSSALRLSAASFGTSAMKGSMLPALLFCIILSCAAASTCGANRDDTAGWDFAGPATYAQRGDPLNITSAGAIQTAKSSVSSNGALLVMFPCHLTRFKSVFNAPLFVWESRWLQCVVRWVCQRWRVEKQKHRPEGAIVDQRPGWAACHMFLDQCDARFFHKPPPDLGWVWRLHVK